MRVPLNDKERAHAKRVAERCSQIIRAAYRDAQEAERKGAAKLVDLVRKRVKLPMGRISPELGKDGFTVAIHVRPDSSGLERADKLAMLREHNDLEPVGVSDTWNVADDLRNVASPRVRQV